MRVGIFGGTFDPPHYGHLIAAEEAREQLDLDRVLFVPAGKPPHKLGKVISPVEDRLAMVALAVGANPVFQISRVDVDRGGPSYTADTLRLLHDQLPPGTELFFIMGMDSLGEITSWHTPEELITLTYLAVATRPYVDVNMEALEAAIPGISARTRFVHIPEMGIASSDLQRRVRERRTIRYQVPPEVEAYISAHGLYRSASDTS